MPPQMPPPQGQPQPEGPGEDESGHGGGAQALVEGIHTDLMKFMDMVQASDPAVAQKLDAVIQAFQAVVQELVGGGGQKPAGPQGQPTAGGPGAVPAM